ncbi:MAG: hypothetical protein HDS39_02140 [Bacteroides sp.]|nr:hypothetical protein [Bacteroides sp.]
MNRLLLIITLVLMSAFGLSARETVTGTVVDSHGEPLPGVKVEVPGTSQYVFTDLDGAFQIILRDPVKKLDFTYPGFGTSSHRVRPEMTVVLSKGWAGNAKGGRSLLDLEGGMGFNGKATFKSGEMEAKDIHTFVMPGFTFTTGYQFNRNLFIGFGTGVYIDILKYECINDDSQYYDSWTEFPMAGIDIPLFVAARWDFGLKKKTAPYVDVRAGYMMFFRTGDDGDQCWVEDYNNNHYSHMSADQVNHGSFFVAPSIGYHMSIYRKFGINLGIRYMAGIKKKYRAGTLYYTENDYKYSSFEYTQRASDLLIFDIGFDF